ncbi:MAG TPA: ribonuclease H-like domain-containing protein [Nitrospirales bacterium]|jgi:predicted PolB exonuclease-like 3'-5' exonuclease|nr:ribonuclease H-like domain-containing protein [Nitrospirales bacterium]
MKVVLDIETIQPPKEEWAALAGVDPTGDLFEYKEFERAAFDGTFSRIICIGAIAFSDDMAPQQAVAWYGGQEKELLRQFWDWIGKGRPSLFVTHNGLGFDLPFLKKRSIIHQVKPTMEISLAKYRTEPVYDTLAIWSNWESRGWVKLDVLARALGVATKSGSGKQVAEMWATGRGKEIAEYCLQDCYVTYACYSKMTFKEPLPVRDVLARKDLIEVAG